jgi:protein CpxP
MKNGLIKFAAVAAMATGMALAQTPANPAPPASPTQQAQKPGKMRAAVRHRMMKALGLTDAQKQQAKVIFQQAKQQTQPLAQQLKQNREALAAAVKADNVSQIQSLSAQQGNLRGQMLAARSEAMAKFYSTLTPEQRNRADKIQQRIKERIQQRMQQGQNG